MKVRVSLELELPDVKDENVPDLQAEYVPGISWEMAHVIQTVFDGFLNFAIVQHLQEAMQWMGRHKDLPHAAVIVKHHNDWADLLRRAEKTMKVEKIS